MVTDQHRATGAQIKHSTLSDRIRKWQSGTERSSVLGGRRKEKARSERPEARSQIDRNCNFTVVLSRFIVLHKHHSLKRSKDTGNRFVWWPPRQHWIRRHSSEFYKINFHISLHSCYFMQSNKCNLKAVKRLPSNPHNVDIHYKCIHNTRKGPGRMGSFVRILLLLMSF